jgi:hypothetical protein
LSLLKDSKEKESKQYKSRMAMLEHSIGDLKKEVVILQGFIKAQGLESPFNSPHRSDGGSSGRTGSASPHRLEPLSKAPHLPPTGDDLALNPALSAPRVEKTTFKPTKFTFPPKFNPALSAPRVPPKNHPASLPKIKDKL